MSKKRYQTWLIPLSGSYFLTVEKGDYTKEEIEAVSKVLLSNKVNYWTGDECRKFEKEFAVFSDSQYAIAVSNGTTALDLAFVDNTDQNHLSLLWRSRKHNYQP